MEAAAWGSRAGGGILSEAIYIVHWLGKDVPACEQHTQKLVALGRFMGFVVSSSLYLGDAADCTNCENEQRARPADPSRAPEERKL